MEFKKRQFNATAAYKQSKLANRISSVYAAKIYKKMNVGVYKKKKKLKKNWNPN